MSQRVQLPPGCSGFRCADGSVYSAKPGTSVVLEDHHASSLAKSQHQSIGLVKSGESFSIGTKKGRWCPACSRVWQAWSVACPRCGAETLAQGEWTESDFSSSSIQNSPCPPDDSA